MRGESPARSTPSPDLSPKGERNAASIVRESPDSRVSLVPHMRSLGRSLLLLCAVSGCNTTLRDALARAEAANKRGDHFGEAIALKEACAADPEEEQICATAKQVENEVISKQLSSLDGACSSEPTACLAGLDVLAPFGGPTDPRLSPYFDRAGEMAGARCEGGTLKTAEDGVFLVRCLEAYNARVGTPTYAARVLAGRTRAAQHLDQLAAQRKATPGVAWLHESLAVCLGGSSFAPRATAYRQSFDDAHSVNLRITGQSPLDPGGLCTQLRSQFGSVLRCDGRGSGDLAVSVDAWAEQMTDAPVREVRTVEVLDHTERWDNPDYRHVQAELRHARNRYEDATRSSRLADADCDTARQALSRAKYCYNCYERNNEQSQCNRKSAADDIERRSRNELSEAERLVSNTPAYLTRDVYRTVSYRTVAHHFRVPWRVRVSVGGGQPQERSGAMTFESTEREGVPAANIGYLGYSEPTGSQRQGGLAEIAADQATKAVATELERVAATRIAGCPAPNEWSDCQVEAALLRRTDPVAQFVTDVGTKLDARTGTPWPKAACLP